MGPDAATDCSNDSPFAVNAILDVLENSLHANKAEWVFLRELRTGTGRSRHSLQRLDAFALNCLAHRGMKRICYEIKTSRADFQCEMRNPLKRRIGMRYSNEFFFVTPPGMLSLDEVPTDCGLIEVGQATSGESKQLVRSHLGFFQIDPANGWYCLATVPAPWRDTPGPTWQFAAAMMRNQQRSLQDAPIPQPKQLRLDLS